MGCFDSVEARCPNCGNVLEFQSKAGKCVLETFKSECVPMAIAFDVIGNMACCQACGSTVTLAATNAITTIGLTPILAD